MTKSKLIRVDEDFKNVLKDISLERIKKGIDKEIKSTKRLTKAILRHSDWKNIKNDLLIKPLRKKGEATDIFTFGIVAFITVMFLGVWFFAHNTITSELVALPDLGGVNMSEAADNTFGQINRAMNPGLHILAFVIIVAFALEIFITNVFIKKNLALQFIIHFLFTIVAVIISVEISNAYETMLGNAVFGTTLMGFRATSNIILNLPRWTVVIGIVGFIFILIGTIIRNRISQEVEIG